MVLKARVILIMTGSSFYQYFKRYDEFEETSLDSKYNRIKEFNKLLTNFKALRSKKPKTQLIKERTMNNVDQLYEKYYDAYKNQIKCLGDYQLF